MWFDFERPAPRLNVRVSFSLLLTTWLLLIFHKRLPLLGVMSFSHWLVIYWVPLLMDFCPVRPCHCSIWLGITLKNMNFYRTLERYIFQREEGNSNVCLKRMHFRQRKNTCTNALNDWENVQTSRGKCPLMMFLGQADPVQQGDWQLCI